jgi:pilus assembly protein CpaE
MRDDEGVSAVEFALLAPMLIFALLAMTDLGLAISERMTIGHVLRAGAQGAAGDVGVADIDLILRTTAAKNMTLASAGSSGNDTSLALQVSRICTCAPNPSVVVVCSATCAGNTPTQVFYALSGQKTYAGLVLPRFSQSKALQVQVR